MKLTLIVLFGSLGCLARWAIEEVVERRVLSHRPYATMAVNVVGATISGFVFLGGVTLTVLSLNSLHPGTVPLVTSSGSLTLSNWSPYLLTGFCGGFTTFSSAIAIPYLDWRHGQRLRGAVLIGATPLLCLLGFWLGETLTHIFW